MRVKDYPVENEVLQIGTQGTNSTYLSVYNLQIGTQGTNST